MLAAPNSRKGSSYQLPSVSVSADAASTTVQSRYLGVVCVVFTDLVAVSNQFISSIIHGSSVKKFMYMLCKCRGH